MTLKPARQLLELSAETAFATSAGQSIARRLAYTGAAGTIRNLDWLMQI